MSERLDRSIRATALMALGGLLLSMGCGKSGEIAVGADSQPARTVAVAKVVRGDMERRYETAAEFRPFQEINLYAKVAGYVKKMYVDIGSRVKKGQLLATLENPELVADLDHARASVARSEQELRRAQGELDRAKSAHDVAHLEFTRLAGVAKEQPGLVAQQEMDVIQGRDRQAEAGVAAAEAALEAARQQLQVDKASVQREQSLLDYSNIVAPFDGVVTQRFADTGAMLAAGTSSEKQALPVLELAQDDLLRLDIPVPESVVPRIRAGMLVTVKVTSLNKRYEGKVVRFSRQLESSTRTMLTEIDVPNPSRELVPGMYATASIALESRPGVLIVPIEAVSRQEDRATVLRVNERSELEERAVQLGVEEPARVEVTSGLKEGDLVAVGARGRLRTGERVAPKIVPLAAEKGGQ